MKIDINFYTLLVELILEEGKRNNYNFDETKEQLHLLVDKATEAAISANEAGL